MAAAPKYKSGETTNASDDITALRPRLATDGAARDGLTSDARPSGARSCSRGGGPGGRNPRDRADYRLADPRHRGSRRSGGQSLAARFCDDGHADRVGSVPHHPAVQRQSRTGGDTSGQQRTRHARQSSPARYRLGATLADDDRWHALSAAGQRPLPDRSLDHSCVRNRTHRPAAGRRLGDLRLGRHRRRDQHHPEAQFRRRDGRGRLEIRQGRQHAVPRLRHVGPDLGRRPGDDELFLVRHRAHTRKFPLEVHLRPQAVGL